MSSQRSIAHFAALGAALLAVFATQLTLPLAGSHRAALKAPPSERFLHAATRAEPALAAQILSLYIQGYDATPGVAGTLRRLDYPTLAAWLRAVSRLDPDSTYAAQLALLYSRIEDPGRKRQMLTLIAENFARTPQRHWRAMAEAAIIARHELKDISLALRYVELLERHANGPDVPGWAQQMHALLLADIGEHERARIVLGALLASGKVHNAHELRLLESRLLEPAKR